MQIYNQLQALLDQLHDNNLDPQAFIAQADNILKNIPKDKTILITQLASMEETILMIPFIQSIQQCYPENPKIIVCYKECIDFIKPFISMKNIEFIPCKLLNNENFLSIMFSSIEFAQKALWDKNIYMAFCPKYGQNIESLCINYFSGASKRIGFNENAWHKYFTPGELESLYKITDSFNLGTLLLTDDIDFPMDLTNDIDKYLYILKVVANYTPTLVKEQYKLNKNKIILSLYGSFDEDNMYVSNTSMNENRKYSLKQYALALLTLLQDNPQLEVYILGNIYDKKYIKSLLTEDIYTLNDGYRNFYTLDLEPCNLPKFEANKVHIEDFSLDQQLELLRTGLLIGNDNYIASLAVIMNSHGIILLSESAEKNEYDEYRNHLSIYLRKYNHSDNIHIIKPEYSLDICVEAHNYGYCSVNYPHCINEISYEQIVNEYQSLN